MTRTTPPRPFDVTTLFPQLAPLTRTATRLHPRPGSPSPHDSSVGGPLLWPADEPWPYCDGPHKWDGLNPASSPEDVRLERRIRADAASRSQGHPEFTPEEREILERIEAGNPWPDGPVALLPIAQMYVRDVPLLPAPGQADLLQVLWCPFDGPDAMPEIALFWRTAAQVTDVLTAPPEPPAVKSDDYLPHPCLLSPEQVTEYPHSMELSEHMQELLNDWNTWQSAPIVPDSSYATDPALFYDDELAKAPGWKVGGWTQWGLTDPEPLFCPACDTEMAPLLTIAWSEWKDGHSWIPYEDQAYTETYRIAGTPDPEYPTMIMPPKGDDMQLYICPESPGDHPHTCLMQ